MYSQVEHRWTTNILEFRDVSIIGFLKDFSEEEDRQDLRPREEHQPCRVMKEDLPEPRSRSRMR